MLEHAGCEVEVLDQHLCCGRPLYDYGFLDMARSYLQSQPRRPSPLHYCCNADGRPGAELLFGISRRIAQPRSLSRPPRQSLPKIHSRFPNFLKRRLPGYQPPKVNRQAIVQGHCHHKAVMRMKEEKSLMDKMELDHRVLESGCCGMAGAFGYEKDKYHVSVACGERSLLPEVRKAPVSTIIVADGFSCKEQIAQETNRHALHLAEVLKLGLDEKSRAVTTDVSRTLLCATTQAAQKESMVRAASVHGRSGAGRLRYCMA